MLCHMRIDIPPIHQDPFVKLSCNHQIASVSCEDKCHDASVAWLLCDVMCDVSGDLCLLSLWMVFASEKDK